MAKEKEVIHEYDEHGAHRLIVGNTTTPWYGYQVPVFLGDYVALTDYFGEKHAGVYLVKKHPRAIVRTLKGRAGQGGLNG